MAEENIWSGTSSQLKNFWAFVACLLVIPIPWAIYRWLLVKSTIYRLTTARLVTTRGIFSTVTDSLELYRVRDLEMTQSFTQRLFGLQDIVLLTADELSPRILIDHIPVALALPDKIRAHVEACRVAKSVRTVDVEDDPGHAQ